MKELIVQALKAINFVSRYIDICNKFKDADNGMNFKKAEVQNIIEGHNIELKYSSKEKIFYRDYVLEGDNLRFVIDYKYGFIECMYATWNKANNGKVRGGFGTLSNIVDPSFERKISYKFPIATSLKDLELILNEIINLHKEFISELKVEE